MALDKLRQRADDAFNSTPDGEPSARDIAWQAVVDELRDCVDDALDCYDGAIEDCNSVVEALIRRIKGEADLESAAEWVRLNYPGLAVKHNLPETLTEGAEP